MPMTALPDLTALVADVLEIAVAVGQRIEGLRRGDLDPSRKADASPVTVADRAADTLLKTKLTARLPVAWLSEETADATERLCARRLWIVDPLDGTKEFLAGVPEYSIAVALVDTGVPVLGVVVNPATDEAYWATVGGGAFRGGRPMSVRDGRRLLASRSEVARSEFDPFASAWDVVPCGSIQLKLARVAAGEGAVTLSRGPKHEWDVCAGALIVHEAGGLATDLFGEPLRFNQPFPKVKGILAGAPKAYRRARAQLKEIGASDRMDELKDTHKL